MAKWESIPGLGIGIAAAGIGAAAAGAFNASGSVNGTIDSESKDFIGVDIDNVVKYVTDIVATKIKTTAQAVFEHQKVFEALESGWSGVSLKNFEDNFISAEKALNESLNAAYAALLDEIVGIINGMVQQDQEMVAKY